MRAPLPPHSRWQRTVLPVVLSSHDACTRSDRQRLLLLLLLLLLLRGSGGCHRRRRRRPSLASSPASRSPPARAQTQNRGPSKPAAISPRHAVFSLASGTTPNQAVSPIHHAACPTSLIKEASSPHHSLRVILRLSDDCLRRLRTLSESERALSCFLATISTKATSACNRTFARSVVRLRRE